MSANAKINSVLSYRQGSQTYFSLKVCCSCCSAAVKNSSISSELGMKRQTEASILRREVIELLDLLLVVDPGVLIISEFLIKLQGVVSLVFLQPKETWVKKLERKTNSGINAQVPLQCTNFFLTSKLKSHGVAQKQTSSKAKYHRHTIKKPVIRVTVQYCNSALLLQPLLMGRRNLLFNYVSVLNTTTK